MPSARAVVLPIALILLFPATFAVSPERTLLKLSPVAALESRPLPVASPISTPRLVTASAFVCPLFSMPVITFRVSAFSTLDALLPPRIMAVESRFSLARAQFTSTLTSLMSNSSSEAPPVMPTVAVVSAVFPTLATLTLFAVNVA